MKKTRFLGTIDRIEGKTAVVIAAEGQKAVEISKDLLPEGCVEGDLVSFIIELKDKRTAREKGRISDLIKKLSL